MRTVRRAWSALGAWLLAALPIAALAQDAPPSPSDAAVADWDLDGAGQFVLSANTGLTITAFATRFAVPLLPIWLERLGGSMATWIGFDDKGEARRCRPVESSSSAFPGNATCGVFLRKARYAFTPGHAGYAGLRYARAAIVWTLP